ncbi:monovalent cation/H(+) antiporter subunit G [Diaminobutyricimonas aerilata]|uniref:monovalent cation/H(+) antiporter subunit G n=1 Tax=Diaminobutyricimonas aerilata TaxID=1162967 RepID=UPI001475933B|nr:monovalent cation/H(+) antiporter subunit G [Diaminobutyricimonas aerilata]
MFEPVLDVIAAVCLLLGALLSAAAGVGLLRFPDALSRMHAASKPQILGLVLVLAAIALTARSWSTVLVLVPVLLFQLLTVPISAHMIGRAGYRTGNFRRELLLVDELEEAVERASVEQSEERRRAEPDDR